MSKSIVKETDKAIMYREERYNHRVTPEITWSVFFKPTKLFVVETKTKRDANNWFDIYNQ
jgi:hypothetical protein